MVRIASDYLPLRIGLSLTVSYPGLVDQICRRTDRLRYSNGSDQTARIEGGPSDCKVAYGQSDLLSDHISSPISTDGKITEHTQTYQMDNAWIVKQKNRSAGENESRAAESSGGRVNEKKKSQMGRQA